MNELELLRKQYLDELKSKASVLNGLIQRVLHNIGCKKAPEWKELEILVHKFAGSSGTYGFGSLSRILSHLESALISKELQGLKREWSAKYLHTWQGVFNACVKEAIGEIASKNPLENELNELSQLLRAREVA